VLLAVVHRLHAKPAVVVTVQEGGRRRRDVVALDDDRTSPHQSTLGEC